MAEAEKLFDRIIHPIHNSVVGSERKLFSLNEILTSITKTKCNGARSTWDDAGRKLDAARPLPDAPAVFVVAGAGRSGTSVSHVANFSRVPYNITYTWTQTLADSQRQSTKTNGMLLSNLLRCSLPDIFHHYELTSAPPVYRQALDRNLRQERKQSPASAKPFKCRAFAAEQPRSGPVIPILQQQSTARRRLRVVISLYCRLMLDDTAKRRTPSARRTLAGVKTTLKRFAKCGRTHIRKRNENNKRNVGLVAAVEPQLFDSPSFLYPELSHRHRAPRCKEEDARDNVTRQAEWNCGWILTIRVSGGKQKSVNAGN
ncbi:hypothetical protein EAI_07212 [Harpegnathos saltator]|uniref:Uncharacterized protein n=1 Tax=Harpegnathos saltator TaxID=610380 RepID=E2B9R2_HARSA|nr:hypothetical protein EAI_07212 [Harpegnathos saltator]